MRSSVRHRETLNGATRNFGEADLSIIFGNLIRSFLIHLSHTSRIIYTERVCLKDEHVYTLDI